jgi:AraC-like DNA-binding protein
LDGGFFTPPHGQVQTEIPAAAAVSDGLGVSHNHLGNQFKAMVGSTSKQLARFYRFGHAVMSIDPLKPVDWTSVAHSAGYDDLSLFDREFIALTGHNPTDYLRLRRCFRSENPGHALDLGLLPTD